MFLLRENFYLIFLVINGGGKVVGIIVVCEIMVWVEEFDDGFVMFMEVSDYYWDFLVK